MIIEFDMNLIEKSSEIIPNQLYFCVVKQNGGQSIKFPKNIYSFTIDDQLIYQNYYHDFGPLNLSCLSKYFSKLHQYLKKYDKKKIIIHFTRMEMAKKTNAAWLIGAFCRIYLKMSTIKIIKLLTNCGPYKPFLDASQYQLSKYTLDLGDCFDGLAKAYYLKFFNLKHFDSNEYDLLDNLGFGGINWIIPHKLLAFSTPNAENLPIYLKLFQQMNVKCVIRLNKKYYNADILRQHQIRHYDLYFPDGSTPTEDILMKFLYIIENMPGAIAVHCRAGLGRTGTLIGAYLIKNYPMTTKEVISWLRICRPGSIIGIQQLYLENLEKKFNNKMN